MEKRPLENYSVTFISPVLELDGVKRLAVFFDKIQIPIAPWAWAAVSSEDARRIEKEIAETGVSPSPTPATVRAVLGPHLLDRDPEIALLRREGLVVTQEPAVRVMEDIEETTPLHDVFETQVRNGQASLRCQASHGG